VSLCFAASNKRLKRCLERYVLGLRGLRHVIALALAACVQYWQGEQIHVNWLYGSYVPKDVPLKPLNGRMRFKLYVRQTFTTPGIYADCQGGNGQESAQRRLPKHER
jgi:hypothetical protein